MAAMRIDRTALGSGVAVACAGFGVMSLFWMVDPKNPRVRGFPDYLSATWGDAICLPVFSTAAVYLVRNLPAARTERRAGVSAGIVGLLLGIGTQVAWLADDAPELNWTLPEPHRFTPAGVYHGVFLSWVAALTAGVATVALLRWTATAPEQRTRGVKIAASLCVLAIGAFGTLLALDNLSSRSTAATVGTAAGVAGGGLLVVAAGLLVGRKRS
jgi:hypothetical protein